MAFIASLRWLCVDIPQPVLIEINQKRNLSLDWPSASGKTEFVPGTTFETLRYQIEGRVEVERQCERHGLRFLRRQRRPFKRARVGHHTSVRCRLYPHDPGDRHSRSLALDAGLKRLTRVGCTSGLIKIRGLPYRYGVEGGDNITRSEAGLRRGRSREDLGDARTARALRRPRSVRTNRSECHSKAVATLDGTNRLRDLHLLVAVGIPRMKRRVTDGFALRTVDPRLLPFTTFLTCNGNRYLGTARIVQLEFNPEVRRSRTRDSNNRQEKRRNQDPRAPHGHTLSLEATRVHP